MKKLSIISLIISIIALAIAVWVWTGGFSTGGTALFSVNPIGGGTGGTGKGGGTGQNSVGTGVASVSQTAEVTIPVYAATDVDANNVPVLGSTPTLQLIGRYVTVTSDGGDAMVFKVRGETWLKPQFIQAQMAKLSVDARDQLTALSSNQSDKCGKKCKAYLDFLKQEGGLASSQIVAALFDAATNLGLTVDRVNPASIVWWTSATVTGLSDAASQRFARDLVTSL